MSLPRVRLAGLLVASLVILDAPAVLGAQTPGPSHREEGGPVRTAPTARFVAPPSPWQDSIPLPVLDEEGLPIPVEEIHGRVEPGAFGLLAGGFLGMALGAGIGAAVSQVVSCGYELQQTLCSPEESALRDAIAGIGAGLGLVVGAAAGWDSDAVSWQEAVEEIREERRAAARRGR